MDYLVLVLVSVTVTLGVRGQDPDVTPGSILTVTTVTGSPTTTSGMRRSGRFQCQEQPEDVQRLHRQGQVQCQCPSIFAPVCGSDGETYHNRCYLTCAATHKYHRFSTSPLTLESWGPCPSDEGLQHNS